MLLFELGFTIKSYTLLNPRLNSWILVHILLFTKWHVIFTSYAYLTYLLGEYRPGLMFQCFFKSQFWRIICKLIMQINQYTHPNFSHSNLMSSRKLLNGNLGQMSTYILICCAPSRGGLFRWMCPSAKTVFWFYHFQFRIFPKRSII